MDEPKPCARCKVNPSKGGIQRYCRPCHTAYVKEWRADKKAGKRKGDRKPLVWSDLLNLWEKRSG